MIESVVNDPEGPDGTPRVSFFTLGCRLNQHDTAALRARLLSSGFREPAALLLGEQEVIAEGDFETASGALDELRLEAELLPELVRQTGGARVVVSDGAVLDGEGTGHGRPPFRPDYRTAGRIPPGVGGCGTSADPCLRGG